MSDHGDHAVADATFGSIQARCQPQEGEDLRQQFMDAAQDRDERSKQSS